MARLPPDGHWLIQLIGDHVILFERELRQARGESQSQDCVDPEPVRRVPGDVRIRSGRRHHQEAEGELMNPQAVARRLVFDYVKPRLEKTDTHVTFSEDEVYVVWFTFILGNWKALLSTTLPDGMYYEVTYNEAMQEFYIDAYKKFDNVKVQITDLAESLLSS